MSCGKESEQKIPMERGSPQFFKVFIPALCSNHLRIPPRFIERIGRDTLGVVSLKGPSGSVWAVELVEKTGGGLNFESGWKGFVGDNLIENGDFLVFRLDAPSCFSVTVFDTTACEKPECFLAKPCKKEYETVPAACNDEDMGNKVMEMPDYFQAPLFAEDDDSSVGKKKKLRSLRYLVGNQCNNSPESNTFVTNGKYASEELRGCPEEMFIMANDMYNMSIVPGNQSFETRLNLFCATSPSKKPTGFGNTSTQCLRLVKSSEMHRYGQLVSKVQKIPSVTSQRRPVTDEEKDNALQRAKLFQSDKPYVILVMRESYVYNGFLMHIPCSFAREHLPNVHHKLTLWDPSGKQWPVNYVTYGGRQSALSGGWSGFSVAHNLEKDDVCVFELVDKDNMKVHIYRVVEETTPLLRSNKMRPI